MTCPSSMHGKNKERKNMIGPCYCFLISLFFSKVIKPWLNILWEVFPTSFTVNGSPFYQFFFKSEEESLIEESHNLSFIVSYFSIKYLYIKPIKFDFILKYLTFDVKQSEQVETSLRSLTKLLWTGHFWKNLL